MSDLAENQLKKELEILTKKYIDMCKTIDNDVYSYVNKYYINVTRSVFKLFNYHSISRSVLNQSDKDLYTNAKQLMLNYKTLIKTYIDMDGYFNGCKALYLVEEIIEIVGNQYKLFEMEVTYDENPITLEKTKIIDTYALNIVNRIVTIEEGFIQRRIIDALYTFKNGGDYENQFHIISKVKDDIQLERIFKVVSKNLNKCIYDLDDLENRKVTNKYFIFLKYQQQLLASIISEQITELDDEMGKSIYDKNIKVFTSLIINQVIEIYELVEEYVEKIERAYRIAPIDQGKEMQYEVFLATFNNNFEKEKKVILDTYMLSKYIETINNYKINFLKIIEKIVIEYKNPLNTKSTYSIVKNDYNTTLKIANVFLKKLSKLKLYSKSNRQLLKTSEDFEIIEGIQQTMEIKAKVLIENREVLQESVENNIENLNYDLEKIEVIIKEKASEIYFKNLSVLDIPIYIDKYIENLIKSKQCEVNIKDLNVDIKEVEKSISSKIFEFKKEVLFYEISTFDEILHYSIEKIKNSSNLNVKKYVMYVEDIKEKLTKLLDENNIEIISPKASDKFNSKEHKVLIAEKKEGFAKGDIIKVNTVGYKEKDLVILKANVIAAK